MRSYSRPWLAAFASVQIGKSLLWAGEDALSFFIMVVALHVPAGLAGVLFLVSSFWNALLDGLWGAALVRWPDLWRLMPLVAGVGACLACLGFGLLPYAGSSFAVAIGALFLFRTSFSIFDVPHNALAASIAGEFGHLNVARWRTIGSATAALLVAAAMLPLLRASVEPAAMARIIMSSIAFGALLFMLPLPWLLAVVPRDRTPASASWVFAPGLLRFCFVQMIGFAALASIGKAMLHLDMTALLAGAAPFVATGTRLASVWLWLPLARWMATTHALSSSYVASALTILMIPLVAERSAVGLVALYVLFGLSTGGIGLWAWARVSELTHAGLSLEAAPRDYGLFTAMMKLGLGLSGAITGAWLDHLQQRNDIAGLSIWSIAMVAAVLALLSAVLNGIRSTPCGTRHAYSQDGRV